MKLEQVQMFSYCEDPKGMAPKLTAAQMKQKFGKYKFDFEKVKPPEEITEVDKMMKVSSQGSNYLLIFHESSRTIMDENREFEEIDHHEHDIDLEEEDDNQEMIAGGECSYHEYKNLKCWWEFDLGFIIKKDNEVVVQEYYQAEIEDVSLVRKDLLVCPSNYDGREELREYDLEAISKLPKKTYEPKIYPNLFGSDSSWESNIAVVDGKKQRTYYLLDRDVMPTTFISNTGIRKTPFASKPLHEIFLGSCGEYFVVTGFHDLKKKVITYHVLDNEAAIVASKELSAERLGNGLSHLLVWKKHGLLCMLGHHYYCLNLLVLNGRSLVKVAEKIFSQGMRLNAMCWYEDELSVAIAGEKKMFYIFKV